VHRVSCAARCRERRRDAHARCGARFDSCAGGFACTRARVCGSAYARACVCRSAHAYARACVCRSAHAYARACVCRSAYARARACVRRSAHARARARARGGAARICDGFLGLSAAVPWPRGRVGGRSVGRGACLVAALFFRSRSAGFSAAGARLRAKRLGADRWPGPNSGPARIPGRASPGPGARPHVRGGVERADSGTTGVRIGAGAGARIGICRARTRDGAGSTRWRSLGRERAGNVVVIVAAVGHARRAGRVAAFVCALGRVAARREGGRPIGRRRALADT